jgi:hypothetical protein
VRIQDFAQSETKSAIAATLTPVNTANLTGSEGPGPGFGLRYEYAKEKTPRQMLAETRMRANRAAVRRHVRSEGFSFLTHTHQAQAKQTGGMTRPPRLAIVSARKWCISHQYYNKPNTRPWRSDLSSLPTIGQTLKMEDVSPEKPTGSGRPEPVKESAELDRMDQSPATAASVSCVLEVEPLPWPFPFPFAGSIVTGLKFAGTALAMSVSEPICTTSCCGFLRTSSS